ncbi:unnamed protein product [Psylliodes chrysocephalus]|uniref:Uncharacterized protein n=1 Tax=Psylliodes chrysocephalus TaxID=3402493 RepID=A0A9P0D5Y7_9CUCU|nr:unnamed protein product [Psylliodes chrysocephala]
MPKKEIVNIFRNENISVSTIYQAIRECEEGIPCSNLPKSGRPRKLSAVQANRLVLFVKNTIGPSTRKLGRRFGICRMTVSREFKRNVLKYRKRRKCPKYTVNQLERIPRCCRSLRIRHFANNKIIIMDDEKYFTFANPEISGNSGFYTDNFNDCPDNVKFKEKAKFEDKIMVWCAISEAGVSRPYVGRVRGQAVDANVYTQNCLPKLLDFINLYHANDEIMLWPDLASCHYAHATRQWLEANHIPFVPREDNPPNVPQARPIETFWALLTRYTTMDGKPKIRIN